MAHEIFISHSSEDKATADAVCGALEDASFSCWIAPRDVRPGKLFPGEIKRAIERCRVMVLIFSAHSNSSDHVLREIDFATRAHAHIINFRIEKVPVSDDLDYYLALPHWLDALTPPTKECLTQLIDSVQGLMELPPKGPALPPSASDSTAPRPTDAPAVPAVFVAPEPSSTPAAANRANLRKERRTLARMFTDAAFLEVEGIGYKLFDEPQLLEPLLRVLARAGDGAGALRVASENGGGFKDFALGIIAETQVRDGDAAGALRTVEACQDKGDAFCRIARAMAESGDVAGALRTVAGIELPVFQGFDPRASALSEIAEAQAKAGDVAGAMRTAASIDTDSPNRLQQKESRRYKQATFSHIAQAQAQAGDADGAGRTLAAIEDAKTRLRAQDKVLAAHARGGDPAGALAAAKESTSDKKGWVFGCIAEVQAQAGDLAGAARTVALIEEEYRRDQAVAAVALAHARTGDFPGAFGTSKDIRDGYIRRKTQARLALARAEAGDPGSARDLVKSQPSAKDRIRMGVAFASLLLDDPAETRWWMDFSTHHLWD